MLRIRRAAQLLRIRRAATVKSPKACRYANYGAADPRTVASIGSSLHACGFFAHPPIPSPRNSVPCPVRVRSREQGVSRRPPRRRAGVGPAPQPGWRPAAAGGAAPRTAHGGWRVPRASGPPGRRAPAPYSTSAQDRTALRVARSGRCLQGGTAPHLVGLGREYTCMRGDMECLSGGAE